MRMLGCVCVSVFIVVVQETRFWSALDSQEYGCDEVRRPAFPFLLYPAAAPFLLRLCVLPQHAC